MRSFARVVVLLGLVIAQLRAAQARAAGSAIETKVSAAGPRRAPGFTERDVFGKKNIVLKSLRGKVVLLNFWATWCAPCLEEVPALEALHGSHEGRVAVIGASVYSSDHDTESFLREHGVHYPVFYGSYELMERYDRVATIPTTFIINRKGEIAAKVVGARSKEQYEDIIRPLL
jgi:thiol-disulfide isomerase/thioredoxin